MLPDIRAAVAAIVAAIGLLAVSFGLAATFRVAQENRAASFQADLTQRARASLPPIAEHRTALLIDTPAPLEPIPVRAVEVREAPDIPPPVEVREAPIIPPPGEIAAAPQAEPAPASPPEPAVGPPAAEPAMGGPLEIVAARTEEPFDHAAEHTAEKERAKKTAARKARAARERLARQRKAAVARRAAQLRAKQQAGTLNTTFGNSFGGFGSQTYRQ